MLRKIDKGRFLRFREYFPMTLVSFKIQKLHAFSVKEGCAERKAEELYSLLLVTVIIVLHPVISRAVARPYGLFHG